MPSGATVDTATTVLLGVALIKVNGTTIGVTRGGVRRTSLAELRSIEHDGKVSAHEVGYERFVSHGERFEFSMIELSTGALDRMLNMSAGSPVQPKANELYAAGRYLENVTLVYTRGLVNGTVEHSMARALFFWTELVGEEKGEATYACAIEPVLNYTGAATTDDAPSTLKFQGSDVGAGLPAGNSQLIADLGGDAVMLAFYDARNNVGNSGGFADTWDDTRGAVGYGPQIVGAGAERPAYAGSLLTFDGVDDYMTSAASALFDLSVAKTLIAIGSIDVGAATPEYIASICDSLGAIRVMAIKTSAVDALDVTYGPSSGYVIVPFLDDAAGAITVVAPTRRLLLASKDATTGLQTRIADSPVNTGVASGNQAAGNNQLSLGTLFPGAGLAPITLRAVMVMNRAFTPSDYALIRAYAQAQHTIVET